MAKIFIPLSPETNIKLGEYILKTSSPHKVKSRVSAVEELINEAHKKLEAEKWR